MKQRQLFNMNLDWKFHDGDIEAHNLNTVHAHFIRPEYVKAGNHGLAFTSYDDSEWAVAQLPHDFVVERNEYDTTTPSCTGSFSKGIVWYRKTIFVDQADEGRRLFLQFDGVHRDCEVWMNGLLIGRHVGGYMGFEFEITEAIFYGQHNSIAVKVDATEYEGWWYEGGGIYRDVRLLKTDQIRVKDHEVYAKIEAVDLETKTADLKILGAVDFGDVTPSNYTFKVSVVNPLDQIVYETTIELDGKKYETTSFELNTLVKDIVLWDLDQPNLYTVKVELMSDQHTECYSTNFGIRDIKYSADAGFELNGRTVKLQGVCGHDDFAGVGTAMTEPIIKYKIERLMEMGVNAYRCAHNPPDPKFLRLCDEMGMLVMDETRLSGICDDDLGDYISMIKRDRNHPCVICWSMGNEEMAIHKTMLGIQIYTKMEAVGKVYDDTRPYVYAINADSDRIVDYDREHGMIQNPVGVNYFVPYDPDMFGSMHERYPDLCIINTETTGICSTREYCLPYDDTNLVTDRTEKITSWDDDRFISKVTCYGSSRPVWGMSPEVSWKVHADRPYSAGLFLWTGFDYRGEVFPYDYPATITFFGIIDLCGFPKDWYYYMQANWTDKDVLHLLPHWNMPLEEGVDVSVWAFTNCDEVELFLNGESKGKQVCEKYGHIEWMVPYNKGTIEAVGYRDGVEIMRDQKSTAGEPTKLVLTPNVTTLKADNEDAVVVRVHLEDKDGNMVITSKEEVEFEFEGACEFLGTGNGDHLGSEPDKEPRRSLFAGRCIVIAKATYEAGTMKITGTCKGLSKTIELEVESSDYMEVIQSEVAKNLIKREKTAADGGF